MKQKKLNPKLQEFRKVVHNNNKAHPCHLLAKKKKETRVGYGNMNMKMLAIVIGFTYIVIKYYYLYTLSWCLDQGLPEVDPVIHHNDLLQ